MSTNLAKKIFAGLSAVAITVAVLPTAALAAAHPVGTNVNYQGTVWMIYNGTSGVCRRAYTSAGAFLSYGFNSWSQVVEANADDLALPVCSEGFIPPQDGSVIFSDRGADKGTGYVVSGGMKYGFPTEAAFKGQGYSYSNATWADVSWMSMGGVVNDAAQAHVPGTLINNGGTVQLVGNSGLMGIPDIATFNSWGYSFAKVVPANAADKAKAQTGVMAMRQAGQLSPVAMTTTPTQPTGPFSAMLHSGTPAMGTVIAGQAIADLAHFTVSGSGTVTSVTLKRLGVSADTTLAATYLYDGNVRLTDSATVSSGVITFNNPAGLFTVSGSKTFSVRSNIAASTAGQTVGVQITHINGTALASQPSGNMFTVASAPSNFATVDFNTTTTPSTSSVDPQNDFTVWQNVITVGNEKVQFKSLKLRQVGSIARTDVQNFRLYVDGVMAGSAVASMDNDSYANFDLGNGVLLSTGNRTIKVVADVIGGSNRNMIFSLRQAADAMFVDNQFGQPVLATAASSAFSARESGTISLNAGSLQVTKRTDSPTGNITEDSSNAVIAKYDVKAFGEAMKVESLRVRIDEDDDDTAFTLRNGALYLDGVQVGSTAAIAADTDTTLAYTEYTFGSSFVVTPGTPRVLEVRADIFDNDGADGLASTDTIQVEVGAGTSNVQRMASLGYGTYPSAYQEAGTLTVAVGSLTVAKNTSYANQSIVAPKNNYLIGSYNIQSSSTEGANITSVVIDFDEVQDAFDASDDITNMYIKIGTYTSPIKSSVADTANTYSTNVTVNAGQTVVLEVWGDIAASSTDGDGTADYAESSATVSYTTLNSNTSTSAAEVDGQTITSTTGSFSITAVSSQDKIVAANQTVEAVRYNFAATSDSYTVTEIQFHVGSSTIASAVNMVEIYDESNPSVKIGEAPFAQETNTAALITGLSFNVPSNTDKNMIVKYALNTIGTGAGTAGVNAVVDLDWIKFVDSLGAQTSDDTPGVGNTEPAGQDIIVYKSIPTVSFVDVTNSKLVNGSPVDLYKFTVTASSQGPLRLKQVKLPIAWTDGSGAGDTLELESFKLIENGSDITSEVVIQDEDGNSVESTSGMVEADGTLTISWATTKEGAVTTGATNTYIVRATPQGFNVTDASATPQDSVSIYLAGDAAVPTASHTYLNGTATATTIWGLHDSAAATGSGEDHNFIWSDYSASPHAVNENASSSADWWNGYKVLNLDLSSEGWND